MEHVDRSRKERCGPGDKCAFRTEWVYLLDGSDPAGMEAPYDGGVRFWSLS